MIMNRLLATIRYTLMAVMCLCFCTCAVDEEMFQKGNDSLIQVVGRVTTYDECNVTSRGIKTSDESHISSMCLFIFDNAGQCINIQYLEGANPTFIVDRELLAEATTNELTACQLYIVANVDDNVIYNTWGFSHSNNKPETNFSLTDFLSKSCATSATQMLTKGFPMIGSLVQSLDTEAELSGAVLEIPLDNLYAKIVFNIQVNLHQDAAEGVTPSFQLSQWEVHNLPTGVSLQGASNGETSFYNTVHATHYTSRAVTGSNPVSGSNVLSFTFYMPEHMMDAGTGYSYPDGIKDADKQRYKPLFATNGKPTYVKIKGNLIDHQGHNAGMEYDVYLGSNNTDNFQVERNCQYNNNITITGGTNHKEAQDGTISVDHRVTMGNSGYYIAIEQEATLDAHWNVVPMDLYIDDGQTVTVTIDNKPDTGSPYSWIRMERIPSANMKDGTLPDGLTETTNTITGNDYTAYHGIRNYFTTNLVTGTLSANTSYKCSNRDRIYFYIDENISLSERTATVSLSFSGDASKSRKLTFTQIGLTKVVVYNRDQGGNLTTEKQTIYIEDKEEYLYHYDPLNTYNTTQVYNGLPWGHAGTNVGGGTYGDPFYEGLNYTNTIVGNNTGYKINDIPETAAEYCSNKNKKDPATNKTPTLSENGGGWYLPAIREMEAIMRTHFDKYEEFQNNFYWSSASAKKKGGFLNLSTVEDNTRARATRVKVTFNNGEKVFNYYESGSTNADDNYNPDVDYDYFVPNGTYSNYSDTQGGYKNSRFRGGRALRSESFRIRAAYRPASGVTVPQTAE